MATIYQRNNSKMWWISFTDPTTNRRVQKSLKTPDKRLAKILKAELEVKLAGGDFTTTPRASKHFSTFLIDYYQYIEAHLRPASVKRYKENCNVFSRFLESQNIRNLKLVGITAPLINDFVSWRLKQVKAKTVNHAVTNIKSMLNLAVIWGYLTKNPIGGMSLIPMEGGRTEFLSTEEVDLFTKAADEDIRPIIQIAVYTGLRRNELAQLQWRDVETKARLLHVRNREGGRTKTRKDRTVPLCQNAIKVLETMPHDSQFVFTKLQGDRFRRNGLRERIVSLARKVGITKHVTTHTLRHTFASHLAMQGKSILIIAKLLGVTIDTAQIYSHLLPHELHSVVDDLPY